MGKLDGKVAVITGGHSGIGLATTQRFVAEGAHVFIIGRRQSKLDEAVKLIGKNVTAVQGDVAKLADLDRLYATVEEQKGRIDVLFANAAGGGGPCPLGEITEAAFDQAFRTNVRGLLFSVQKALPLFQDGGSIILNASIFSIKGIPTLSLYCAGKAAVRSFARSWTSDLKDRKIRVNTLSPGPIDTPIQPNYGLTKEQIEQYRSQFITQIPMGRLGTTDEVANAALFLASDASSFVTGIELYVDGGMAQV